MLDDRSFHTHATFARVLRSRTNFWSGGYSYGLVRGGDGEVALLRDSTFFLPFTRRI